MKEQVTRRNFLAAAGTAALAAATTTVAASTDESRKPLTILGVSCSARKGMNTAKSVQLALEAAKDVDTRIEIELLDLGGLNISGWAPEPIDDDFNQLLPKLKDPSVSGLIIGSPSYFRGLSSRCKAFIERCAPLREPEMLLGGKPIGVVAVGGFRNGGQELVIEQIQTAMLCFGMIPVGGHAPAFQGATLQSSREGIKTDVLGVDTARQLGQRVGELAIKLVG